MSLTPGDPSFWSGVMFVRKGASSTLAISLPLSLPPSAHTRPKQTSPSSTDDGGALHCTALSTGPYATAILRFYIAFPDTYPALPPLVSFETDMFHPLITPLTTYMYTTDIQEGGTVSATDEERLPPGGFSLRHGFPAWFGRGRKRWQTDGQGQGQGQQQQVQQQQPPTTPRSTRAMGGGEESRSSTPNSEIAATASTPSSAGGNKDDDDFFDGAGDGRPGGGVSGGDGGAQSYRDVHRRDTSTFDVLSYVKSTFDDDEVLDSVPLEAAGNPGAWHAWRTHRGHTTVPEGNPAVREPGEWSWEGVWEERVQRNIQASMSEPVLFGNEGGDEIVRDSLEPTMRTQSIWCLFCRCCMLILPLQIRFLNMEETEVETVIDNLYKTMGESARADPLAVPSVNLNLDL